MPFAQVGILRGRSTPIREQDHAPGTPSVHGARNHRGTRPAAPDWRWRPSGARAWPDYLMASSKAAGGLRPINPRSKGGVAVIETRHVIVAVPRWRISRQRGLAPRSATGHFKEAFERPSSSRCAVKSTMDPKAGPANELAPIAALKAAFTLSSPSAFEVM